MAGGDTLSSIRIGRIFETYVETQLAPTLEKGDVVIMDNLSAHLILGTNEFFGEGCLAGQAQRIATVATITESVIVRLEKAPILRVIHQEPAFSELLIAHLLGRTIRVEADLVDQLFNSSEKRLARLLLLLANFGKEDKPEPIIAAPWLVDLEAELFVFPGGRHDDQCDSISQALLDKNNSCTMWLTPEDSEAILAKSRIPGPRAGLTMACSLFCVSPKFSRVCAWTRTLRRA